MLRTSFIVVLLLALVAGVCTSATAGVSWLGLMGTGSDRSEVSAHMSIETTSGVPVGVNGYIVEVPQGEGLRCQLIFAGDGGPKRYSVEYSFAGAPEEEMYRKVGYDYAGWMINIPADRLYTTRNTPLHLRVRDLEGEDHYIQILFFRLDTGSSPVTATDSLLIRVKKSAQTSPTTPVASQSQPVVVADPAAIDGELAKVGTAIKTTNNNVVKVAGAVDSLGATVAGHDARIIALEDFAKAASAASTRPPASASPTTSTLPTAPTGYCFLSAHGGTWDFYVRSSGAWKLKPNKLVLSPGGQDELNANSITSLHREGWNEFGIARVGRVPNRAYSLNGPGCMIDSDKEVR